VLIELLEGDLFCKGDRSVDKDAMDRRTAKEANSLADFLFIVKFAAKDELGIR